MLGILFANWYSNGNEIPVDKDEALTFWKQKLADVRDYASTNQWLMMNGCDHQPVQRNISEAIRVANELFPDVTFIHSSFDEYVQALESALPEQLTTVTGELTSRKRMAGTPLPIPLLHVFTSNKPSKKIATS